MGKKKAYHGGTGKSRQYRRGERAPDREHIPQAKAKGDEVGLSDDSDSDNIEESSKPRVNTRLCMWEFGQNDPKRDSGSKLRRLGYASLLRIGQSFPGMSLVDL